MKQSTSKTIKIGLEGIRPILFARYSGDNKTQLEPIDKLYVEDGLCVIPTLNVMSFLSAQLTESAPQRVCGRGWKVVAKAVLAYGMIDEEFLPIIGADGKPIKPDSAQIKIRFHVARIKKGNLVLPSAQERPSINTPWSVEMTFRLLENPDLNETLLRKLFEIGGLTIGFGTYRGVFGKFRVSKWEVTND